MRCTAMFHYGGLGFHVFCHMTNADAQKYVTSVLQYLVCHENMQTPYGKSHPRRPTPKQEHVTQKCLYYS